MRLSQLKSLAIISLVFLVGQGCASKKANLPLADEFWQQQANQKISVALYVDPVAELSPRGGVGILDLAIINAANKTLNNALKKYKFALYHELNTRFVNNLKERKIAANTVDPLANIKAEKSFTAQLGDGKLLSINLVSLGVTREYYGFIPRSYPESFCVLEGKLLDSSNKELWYHQAEIAEPIVGKWDQPPHYRNILASLDKALSNSAQELLDSFFSGH